PLRARRQTSGGPRPAMVLIVPAHDEEAVIGDTIDSLLRLEYDDYRVIVLNDGSTDMTSERAHAFDRSGRVLVVDRPPEIAGRGKGDVLNEGYRVLNRLLASDDPFVRGLDTHDVVVGIVDADGHLE